MNTPTNVSEQTLHPDPDLSLITEPEQRLTLLGNMLKDISNAHEPGEVLKHFGLAMARLYGTEGYASLSTRGLPPGHYRITRTSMPGSLTQLEHADPWSTLHQMTIHSSGVLSDIVARGEPTMLKRLDLAADPVLGATELRGFASLLAVPLFDQGQPLNWAIRLRRSPECFTLAEMEEMMLRGNLVGGQVRLTLATREIHKAHQKVRAEMDRIADIQRALLPDKLPEIIGVDVATSYQVYDTAGGDYYNFHPLGVDGLADGTHDGRWGFMIADVSGHGPAAAVVMAILQTLTMTAPLELQHPARFMDYLNRHLCAKRIGQNFVTCSVFEYHPDTGKLLYTNAGHPPALVRKKSSNPLLPPDILRLDAVGGVPLGILEDETYDVASMTLEPGDTLLLYTDGIPETRNSQGEFFGEEGLRSALIACASDARCTLDTLNERLRRFEAGGTPQDDQTLVALHIQHLPT